MSVPSVTCLILALLCALLTGCVTYQSDRGVANVWRDVDLPEWQDGVTTESDVTRALGPPSQIIGVNDQTVYYYMRERRKGKGFFLLVYNKSSQEVRYDRAVFFFDRNGVLVSHSLSIESQPYEKDS
ncbi:MAG: hypothetical protein U9R74_17825 [Pseudomonadota bacterium]|nr:hypothetical protein [Pseudomonadota bacterium]